MRRSRIDRTWQFVFAGSVVASVLSLAPLGHAQGGGDGGDGGDTSAPPPASTDVTPVPPPPAPPEDDQLKNTARNLALQGHELFKKGDYANALDMFQRAYELVPAPTIALRVARSLAQLGRLIEAAETYEKIRRTPVADGSPPAFAEAIEEAKLDLEVLRPRIPTLNVKVSGQGADDPRLQVLLDGKVVPPAVVGANQTLDPGEHLVEVRLPGHEPLSRKILVGEGRAHFVELDLDRVQGTPGERDGFDHVMWGGVSLSAGGAFAIMGIITGVIALGKKSDLDAVCQPKCPKDFEGDADTFATTRTLSYIGVGAGAALGVLGVVLLLTAPRDEEATGSRPDGSWALGSWGRAAAWATPEGAGWGVSGEF